MTLRDLLPHLGLMLVGGLASSLGLGQLCRTARVRALLSRLRWWGLGLVSVAVLGVSAGGLYPIVRGVLDQGTPDPFALAPGTMLIVGALAGLPFSLPTVVAIWSEESGRRARRRTAPATKDDRRAYAGKLASQIRNVSDGPTRLQARIVGDGGRVLSFEGDLDARQGERLVAALRTDLKDHGFKRVEGKGPQGTWWTDV